MIKVALFEELERVKLQFIAACEQLLDQDKITEEDFECILEILENIDNYSDEELISEINKFTKGVILFPGKF